MKLIPRSSAFATMAVVLAVSAVVPNWLPPRPSADTCTPVRPSGRYFTLASGAWFGRRRGLRRESEGRDHLRAVLEVVELRELDRQADEGHRGLRVGRVRRDEDLLQL